MADIDPSDVGMANELDGTELEMRKVQKQGRVDIPSEWLDALGWEEGDGLHLTPEPEEGEVRVMKASVDNIE